MSKRIECFTVYWNDEADKVTIKTTPEFKSDPITIHHSLEWIIDELKEMRKKNFKKAEKAGLDIHLGCDSWPECDESPGGCNLYNDEFENEIEEREPFKFLTDHDLFQVSAEATNQLKATHEGAISLELFRMVVAKSIQTKLQNMNS
jgi:hypothetical protein